jgi:hypothetical protein
MSRPLIAYVRVSTSKQGRSGLGLEAQQEALSRFAETESLSARSSKLKPVKAVTLLSAAHSLPLRWQTHGVGAAQ